MVIDTWENGQYKEIWVYSEETDDDERAMCGLINGDWGLARVRSIASRWSFCLAWQVSVSRPAIVIYGRMERHTKTGNQ